MNSNIFQLVTVNDRESDSAAIVNIFSNIASQGLECDLKLLNYCGEVPVSYGFNINTVDKDFVELAVHEHQALIINHDRYTLINSERFHNELVVHCNATFTNLPRKTVVLNNFSYAQMRPEQRESVRVRIPGDMPVKFCCDNLTVEGSIVEMSGNCISICSNLIPSIKTDQTGLLFFTINGIPLAVTGTFIKTCVNASGGQVCIFQMKPDRTSDSIIDSFIHLRQGEIIRQLKFFFT